VNPCSSRSRSPLAVGLTVARRLCPRPESTNSLLQVGFSTFHSQKSTRDYRGFPSPESVHLLAVLPVVQGRASRVLSDSNNHLLTIHSNASDWPRRTGDTSRRAVVTVRCFLARVISKKNLRTSLHQTGANSPQKPSFRLTGSGEPDSIPLRSGTGDTRAHPPIRHPKRKTSMASRFQQLVIPTAFRPLDAPGEPATTNQRSATGKVLHKERCRKPIHTGVRRKRRHPPNAL